MTVGWAVTRTACEAHGLDLDTGAVQAWLELEMAKLKLVAQELVASYFRECRERSYSHKIWPRLKEYRGRLYVVWCRKSYVNPRRGIVRTEHISRGQRSYRRRLAQVCQHWEKAEKAMVLGYEERFEQIRLASELLVDMLAQLERYQKAQKHILFGPDKESGVC